MILNWLEPIAIFVIFAVSLYLIKTRFAFALYLLMILTVLVHKELFSFYRWDLMPVRIFMFALLSIFVAEFFQHLYLTLIKKGSLKKFIELVRGNPYSVLLGLMWAVNGLSLVFSLNLKASILLFGFFTTVLILFVKVFYLIKDDPQRAEGYLKFYSILAFLLSIFGYFQLYLYQSTGRIIGSLWNIPGKLARVGATFWDVNHYGAFLAAIIPLSFVFALTAKKWSIRIFYLVVTLSLCVTLIITNSRSAWIMEFVAGVSFAMMLMVKRFGRKGIIILLTPIVLFFATVGFMYTQKASPVRASIKQYMHYRIDSFDSHVLLLQGTYEIFKAHPILGGGYGSFFENFSKTSVAPTFFGRDPAALTSRVPAHTIWGEAMSDTGAVGLGILLAFCLSVLLTILYTAIKTTSSTTFLMCSAMFSALLGWMFAGIFYSYNAEFYWLLWVLFVGYAVAAGKLHGRYSEVLEYFFASRVFSKVIILSVGAVMIFWALGNTHLIPWDEAIYAKIAKNMVTTSEYISMQWKSKAVWFEKPPLYMWMQTLFMHVLGFNAWAVRLPSAILGFLTLAVVYAIANRMFNRTVALVSVVSLMSTTHFMYYSRTGMLDVAVTFFITLAFYLYQNAKIREQDLMFVLSGLSIGLAIMTKGVVGVLALVLLVLIEIFAAKRLRVRHWLLVLFGTLVVALPWHLAMYFKYGITFLDNYIGYHVIDRAASAIEDKGNPWWWYVILIKVTMRLWFVVLLGAFPYAMYRVFKRDARITPIFLWFLLIFGVFSLAKSKLAWYIMPLYPAAALLNGVFVDELLRFLSRYIVPKYYVLAKSFALFLTVYVSFIYLLLNKELVYTSDLTGAQARLMEAKEQLLGKESRVFLDRIELPLALYYLDGPFEIVDFTPTKLHKVPQVSPTEKLILLTKRGRYSETVAGYTQAPTIIREDGDWILWTLPAKEKIRTE
jgi:hypothetical protein